LNILNTNILLANTKDKDGISQRNVNSMEGIINQIMCDFYEHKFDGISVIFQEQKDISLGKTLCWLLETNNWRTV